MNSVIIKDENKKEFECIPAVFEETDSTPNGVKSPVTIVYTGYGYTLLLDSQKCEIIENNTHIPSASCINSESGKKNIASKKKRKAKKAKDGVKRPLNAFMLYLKEKRAEFVANSTINKYPSLELNKVVGKLWRSLTDEQRDAYYAQAREERRRHALLHPRKEPPRPRKRTCLPYGSQFKKCRAKYGLDSKNLWCLKCRSKKKCLWLLKALAEENGGVLPKLPLQEPPKDSSEKNDTSSTISKTGFKFRKCRAKYGLDSKHLWCANCRRKRKCLWLLTTPAEENGVVLPKLPLQEPSKDSSEKNDSSSTISKTGLEFRNCRAKYGMDSQNLWCANCRRKRKCLWLLTTPAEENGGVLPKLPLQEPSKDSSEKNDSSSTISKTGFKFRKCRAKYGLDSKHLWCANCRRKRKCLWLLKTLAEENGGVLPKLPLQEPPKDSSEKNDSSSTISKTDFEWIPAVFEETVSTPNGVISPVLLKSQEGEIIENNTHIPSASCIDRESGKKNIASKKKRKDKKAKDRVKKPLNAFMLYLKEKRAEFVANSTINKYPSLELTKVVGKLWRSLTDEQRAAYYAQAREELRRHALLHPRKDRRPKRTCLPDGFKFRNCRAKYGLDSKHLWCANCRRKQKCLLKALAEENGGVLPKLPLQEPSKDSSEKNDSSSTISKTDINLEKCLQKDNTDLENQESKPRTKRKAIPADGEYNIYVGQPEKMAQSCFVFDGQNEFAKFCLQLNAKYDDDKSCLETNAKEDDAKSCLETNFKEDDAKSCFELNAKEDDAKSCLEMNATQGVAKSCFEKNVRQDTELDDNGKEIQIEPYEMKNEIEDFVPHIVKLEIIECEETKIGGIASQAAAIEKIKVENIKEENIEI